MSTQILNGEHVLRSVYDPTTESLKTIPSAATSFSIELDATDGDSVSIRPLSTDVVTLLDGVSAGSDQSSSSVNVLNDRGYAVQVVWSSLTLVLDGTIKLLGSVDDITFTDVTSEVTLSSASGSYLFNQADVYYKSYKLVYTKNSIVGGIITAKATKKG